MPDDAGFHYPEFTPFHVGHLPVTDGHTLCFRQWGNAYGLPVLISHGGPGGSMSDVAPRLYDPRVWRIIQMDQRGCGHSIPAGELENNTTQHLIDDMEALRRYMQVDAWVLGGASWGSTLSLAYAQQHPQRVLGMLLSSIFLARPQDIAWVFEAGGASEHLPLQWQRYAQAAGTTDNMVDAFGRLLYDADPEVAQNAAAHWSLWEGSLCFPELSKTWEPELSEAGLAGARLEHHYESQGCHLPAPILEGCDVLAGIPVEITHGDADLLCPIRGAEALHAALPDSTFTAIPGGGHVGDEPEAIDEVSQAAARLAALLRPTAS